MKPKTLNEYLESIGDKLPGYLAAFNGTNFKLRNDIYGHDVIDKEITEFGSLLSKECGGDSIRLGGNSWLGFFKNNPVERTQSVMNDFYHASPIESGWRTVGYLDGDKQTKSKTVTVQAKIMKSVRCVYSSVDSAEKLNEIFSELDARIFNGVEPNVPHELRSIDDQEPGARSCISKEPDQQPCCPFCEQDSLHWASNINTHFGRDTKCENCGAEVDINYIQEPG